MNKVAVFISGRGSNLEAILRAKSESPHLFPTIQMIITDHRDAPGVSIGFSRRIPVYVVANSLRVERESAAIKLLQESEIDFIVLAGYMRILSESFCNIWEGRMINIHPSLLPKYKGLHSHRRSIENKDKIHGCSIHYVTGEVDGRTCYCSECNPSR